MIQTIPASTRRAMRSPLARSRVQIDEPRPKRESLAWRSASSSLSTVTIGRTGPKISSCMIRISGFTPVRTVGAMNLPGKPGTSRGPPVRRSAPLAIASSTSSVTVLNWSSETIGPVSVVHSSGSPTVRRSVSRTTPSRKRSATSSTT